MANYNSRPGMTTAQSIRNIFMIVVYIGMGVLCMTGFFGTEGWWVWLRWVAGGILIAYGLLRTYLQFCRRNG